jgi:glucose-6-phosphate 1-dehydrogenase
VILGASGDLAVKKTYPALFSLYVHDLLPLDKITIYGYARSHLDLEEFRKKISSKFPSSADSNKKKHFLDHCYYFTGQYDSEKDFQKINEELEGKEKQLSSKGANRIFYFAIPPNVFIPAARSIAATAISQSGWTRVIVEKPFGHDLESSAELNKELSLLFTEDQIYRIDHYLGKEMVQNLMVLRFANKVFEPIWNRDHVQAVMITFKEDFGTQGRGGYFDSFGIIRDVMQNHLLQILSLVGMEAPVSLGAEDVRDEKVKLLRAIQPITRQDIVVGQYSADPRGKEPGYTEDKTVPNDSVTPTFAAAVLHVNNARWHGTPFILKCGKALNEKQANIRIQFKIPHNNIYDLSDVSPNELVLRVQPDEAVYLKMSTKKPGLQDGIAHIEMDLSYKQRFSEEAKNLPDAYERLIFDVLRGDHNLFVRADELIAAWQIFTPILHELDGSKQKPIQYEFGSRGPKEADELIKKYGYNRTDKYSWNPPEQSKL